MLIQDSNKTKEKEQLINIDPKIKIEIKKM